MQLSFAPSITSSSKGFATGMRKAAWHGSMALVTWATALQFVSKDHLSMKKTHHHALHVSTYVHTPIHLHVSNPPTCYTFALPVSQAQVEAPGLPICSSFRRASGICGRAMANTGKLTTLGLDLLPDTPV